MDVRRGLWRLWILASVLWAGFHGWLFWDNCIPGSDGDLWCPTWLGDKRLPSDLVLGLRQFGYGDALRIAAWLFGPPVACLIIGLGFFWVGDGFSERPRSN
jgi:hypothetical protein